MAITEAVEEAVLSVAEAAELLNDLSDAETLSLKKASNYLSFGNSRAASDLRQEAFKRVLAGTRKCPRNLPIVEFLFGVMRSIAYADRVSSARGPQLSVVPKEGYGGSSMLDCADSRLSPEDALLKEQGLAEIKKKVIAIFNDDEIAQLMIEGILDGMEGQELREFVGLCEKDFDTKRRFIRRRIDRAFPDGFKP